MGRFRRKDQPCLFFQNSNGEQEDSPHFQIGQSEPFAWNHSAKTRLCSQSSPTAERVSGELPPSTSSLSMAELGPSDPHGRFPSTTTKAVLVFLVALQPSMFPEGHGWTVCPYFYTSFLSHPTGHPWPHITSAQPEADERPPCYCHPPLLLPALLPSFHPTEPTVLGAELRPDGHTAYLFLKGCFGWQTHKGGIRAQPRGRITSLHLLVFPSPCFGLHCWS